MMSPLISVVMPVHNAAPYLDASIRSILGQTFKDFEFVILDDGSTDESNRILREWAQRDERIRLFENRRTLGLVGSSNRVVAEARAPLLARMDADDISQPSRLERQWRVLSERPDVALVGTLWEGIDGRGRGVRPRDRWRLVKRSLFAPFPHGSIMFRRERFDEVGGYREACVYWEDFDLYLRMADRGRIVVLPDTLYSYRFHSGSTTQASADERIEHAVNLMYHCVAERRAGRDYTALLHPGNASHIRQHRAPRTFFSLGSPRLWSGHPPAMLGPLLKRGSLGLNRATLQTFVWAMWGTLSPASLRYFLRGLVRVRDRAASRFIKDGRPYEWRFE
jgi:glycosyltransferase involved in cell wall biosynthesis